MQKILYVSITCMFYGATYAASAATEKVVRIGKFAPHVTAGILTPAEFDPTKQPPACFIDTRESFLGYHDRFCMSLCVEKAVSKEQYLDALTPQLASLPHPYRAPDISNAITAILRPTSAATLTLLAQTSAIHIHTNSQDFSTIIVDAENAPIKLQTKKVVTTYLSPAHIAIVCGRNLTLSPQSINDTVKKEKTSTEMVDHWTKRVVRKLLHKDPHAQSIALFDCEQWHAIWSNPSTSVEESKTAELSSILLVDRDVQQEVKFCTLF